jgi:hypothetical protein
MKNSILILGIALVSLTNVCSAANATGNPFHLFKESVFADNKEVGQSNKTVKFVKPFLSDEAEAFNPETVIAYNTKTVKEIIVEVDKIIENTSSDDAEFMAYEESMKEVVAQSDLIIENTVGNETYPLYIVRTMEDEIAEMELIIENTVSKEAKPLDFKKINNNSIMNNTFNSKRFIGMN